MILDFEEYVNNLKRKIKISQKEILILCIGTSEVIWDSIGPLAGSYLKDRIGRKNVLGDINHNICNKWDLLYNYYKIKNKYIIAIDTAIADKQMENKIFISNTPIVMGLALNKNKGIVGDTSIKIAISDLNVVNYDYVKNVSYFIAEGICQCVPMGVNR